MSFNLNRVVKGLMAMALGLVAPPVLVAATLPAGVSKVATVEGVSEYRLANGLKVVLAPDASTPVTTVNMTYLVGSRHENYGQTGMAHLLEHMLFKGTPTTPNALGEFSRRGLQANGTTSTDRTNYYASFAASPENLEWYLRWQADAMVNSTIASEDLASEMTVVRNEMESGENSPFRVLMQRMQSAAYLWHSYGKSTIGARSDVENVDIAQLRNFYRVYYQPDNAVLVLSGAFDEEATLAMIADAFGKIPRPQRELPREYTVEPVQDGERSVTVRRVGGTSMVAALYHVPSAAAPDYVYFNLATMMLSDTPSGQLYRDLVQNNLATGVFGFAMARRDAGVAMFGAQLQPGMSEDKALEALTDVLESQGKRVMSQQDLDRARNQWLTDWERTFGDAQSLGIALTEAIAAGDWRLFFLQRDWVRNAGLDEVESVSRSYLVRSNRTSGRYVPTDKPVRAPELAAPDVAQLVADYAGDGQAPPAEVFDTSPAAIDAATMRKTLTLPNGSIGIAMLPKSTRSQRAEAVLKLYFGDAETLKGHRVEEEIVADMLGMGTKTRSRQEINDEIDSLRGTLGISGGKGQVEVTLSAPRENLPRMIALVFDLLRNPVFPQDELKTYLGQESNRLRNAMSDPMGLAGKALARHDNPWAKDDVRYQPTFQEELDDLKAVKREKLKAFHEAFYGAGQLTFSAVGDFDAEAAEQALVEGVAGWRKAPSYTRVDNGYRKVDAQQFEIETPDKANAFYLAGGSFEMQDDNPDYPALMLSNFLLGASETSRLWMKIREEAGLSYSVRSHATVSAFEPAARWRVYAIFAPSNRERLETLINETLSEALEKGFTDKEVAEGIEALLNYQRLSRTVDENLAQRWSNYQETGRSFAWVEAFEQKLRQLDAAEVNRVLRKYMHPDDWSRAIAGDFSKKP
ncbi:zinc protease [Kerstersia gyiorum]|nr:pitrilysin family protein [Kerstersia gyiorum]MCP1713786.1 zinc protease [Kerstersia gyiorum]